MTTPSTPARATTKSSSSQSGAMASPVFSPMVSTHMAAATLQAPTATPIGGRAFCSPAMIRILLTPATPDVTPDQFERMTAAIRQVESIRLSDLPPSATRKPRIQPPGTPLARKAEVHLSFVTSYDPSHSFLSPFNVHRQVLGVLGVASCSSSQSVERLQWAPAALRQLHPSAVVHRVFGFDSGAAEVASVDLGQQSDDSTLQRRQRESTPEEGGGDMGAESLSRTALDSPMTETKTETSATTAQSSSPPPPPAKDTEASANAGFSERNNTGLVIFPAVRKDLKDVRFYLKTLVPQFIGDVLDGLEAFIEDLQGKPLETPRETLDGALAAQSASTSLTSNGLASARMLSSNVGAAASSAASRASALFSSFSSNDSAAASRKVSRTDKTIIPPAGTGPTGTGRLAKVKADHYLLAGDLWSAAREYHNCLTLLGKDRALAGGQDAVWYASALEGWAVTRVLTVRMGGQVAEQAPATTLPQPTGKEKDKVANDFAFSGKPWSDVAEAYSLALTIYSKCLAPASYLLDTMRSVTPDTPRDFTHPLIHTSACLSYARLLLAIWASGGWNGETFDQLLLGGVPPALAETTRPSVAVYLQHATASGIQRSDIAAPASQSITNSSSHALKMLDQIHLYSSLAAIYGCLGYARKEAYAVRRLQALVVVLIAQGVHLQKQKGSTSSHAWQAGDPASGTLSTQIASIGGGLGSDSILVLALQICQTYGINVQLLPLLDMDRGHILLRASVDVKGGKKSSAPAIQRHRAGWPGAAGISSLTRSHDSDWQRFINDEVQARQAAISELLDEPPFGWVEQQIAILKDTLSICEMLQDRQSLLFFGAMLLRDFWPHLNFEDQYKLKDGIAKIMTEAQHSPLGGTDGHGTRVQMQYWGPRDLLAGVALDSDRSSVPQKVLFNDLPRNDAPDALPEWARRRPRPQSAASADTLVQDEVVSFTVTLHNPLQIPLELESIRLELQTVGSVGPTFEPVERRGIVLPPNAIHALRLTGTPRGEGRLRVRGISIKVPHCTERLFTFEYGGDVAAQKTLFKAQGELDDRWTRIKRMGLEARGGGSTGVGLPSAALQPKARARAQESQWLLQVIAKVPAVEVHASQAIRAGTMLLYDGEERTASLTVQNVGQVEVDHLQWHFEDDVQRDLVEVLAEGQVDRVDRYDLERDLLHRPFLSPVDTKTEVSIPPGQSQSFQVRIRGKMDVRQGTITVQFGNRASSRALTRDHFWVRQACIRFDVRILPTVFLDGLEVMPWDGPPIDDHPSDGVDAKALSTMTDKAAASAGLAVVSVAAHNGHPCEMEVQLEVPEGSPIRARIPAHTSSRLHFFLRQRLPHGLRHELVRPVPQLVPRQFIASPVARNALEEARLRASFWTRQGLLESLARSRWTDVKTRRTGWIDTTAVQVTSMEDVAALYVDPIEVTVAMHDGKATTGKTDAVPLQPETPTKKGKHKGGNKKKASAVAQPEVISNGANVKTEKEGGALKAAVHDFVEVRMTLHNRSDTALGPLRYRLTPQEITPGSTTMAQQMLCSSGHMQGNVAQVPKEGQHEVYVGLCFLTRGTFRLRLDVFSSPAEQATALVLEPADDEEKPRQEKGNTDLPPIGLNALLDNHAHLTTRGITVHVH